MTTLGRKGAIIAKLVMTRIWSRPVITSPPLGFEYIYIESARDSAWLELPYKPRKAALYSNRGVILHRDSAAHMPFRFHQIRHFYQIALLGKTAAVWAAFIEFSIPHIQLCGAGVALNHCFSAFSSFPTLSSLTPDIPKMETFSFSR